MIDLSDSTEARFRVGVFALIFEDGHVLSRASP